MKPRTMLFLCTANYYRSRFAELVFNHLAAQLDPVWAASSRGLALELGVNNAGPIAPAALAGLGARGIVPGRELRSPIALSENELENADHIVAVNRAEHLPMLQGKFPRWIRHIEFWDVHDRHLAAPEEALAQLEDQVRRLIERLYAFDRNSSHVLQSAEEIANDADHL
jgi:protein-tyrosine phosphatase